jgi:hypothetical protein
MKDTSENREKRQRESYAEECRVWAHENREAIASLKAKLFAIGGNKISPQPCPFVLKLPATVCLLSFQSNFGKWTETVAITMLPAFGSSGRNTVG